MTGANLVARLTRRSRSNFYYAFLALPKPRRDALYAVYAFCRTVDDVATLAGGGVRAARARGRGFARGGAAAPLGSAGAAVPATPPPPPLAKAGGASRFP